MPDPADLLQAARLLLTADPQPPTGDRLRRAVSTAYYALFHMVLASGARRFVGVENEGTAGYRLIYRALTHGRIKSVCASLDKNRLSIETSSLMGGRIAIRTADAQLCQGAAPPAGPPA